MFSKKEKKKVLNGGPYSFFFSFHVFLKKIIKHIVNKSNNCYMGEV